MATYTETITGGVEISGCAVIIFGFCVPVAFAEGDSGFVKADAENKGRLTRIVVKRVIVDPDRVVETKVVDTFNTLWFESELVNHSTAIDLARAYHEAKAAEIEEYIAILAQCGTDST